MECRKTCLEREGACVGYRLQASSQQILMAFPLTNKWVIGFQGEKIEPIALWTTPMDFDICYILLCHHIWYNIFCLFIFHFKLSWDHVKLSVIFHSGVHLSVTKSSYSLDYETDDLSKLRITISSGAWRILRENIAKLINFYMLTASRESLFLHTRNFD